MSFMAISCTPEADAVLTADKIAEQTRGDVRPFILPAFQDEDGLDETRIMKMVQSLIMLVVLLKWLNFQKVLEKLQIHLTLLVTQQQLLVKDLLSEVPL